MLGFAEVQFKCTLVIKLVTPTPQSKLVCFGVEELKPLVHLVLWI